MIRDLATQRQVDAAAPGNSTWLAANAGSGKTRVLTDRVARLLLEGVLPEHILCLTYTKAAATEMQNRLFKRLGAWAMLESDALRAELRSLGVEQSLNNDFLRDARTLFARAIETPGGLRIQTIHSFCSSLLRRFPLEAEVSPQFQEMEDRAAERLRAEILDQMAEGPQAHLLHALAPYISGDDSASLLAGLTRNKADFIKARSASEILGAYGLPENFTEESIAGEVFLGDEKSLFDAILPVLDGSGSNGQKLADALKQWKSPDSAGLSLIETASLTKAGTVNKRLFVKKVREAAPGLVEKMEMLLSRVECARERRFSLLAAERDIALHNFAAHFVPAYEQAKQLRGWLDFDDLIIRARDLLNDPKVAAWVLFKLDGGIDHILVDEAQDTSPVQWQVIERLAQEFTAGEGARADVRRTIFVVGDKKQSIYSFQGADPAEFDHMRDEFGGRLKETDAPLNAMELEHSFRSADPILRLVDMTFDNAEASGFTPDQKHIAFKDQMPGRVDLWPVVGKVEEEKDGDWFEPVDRVGAQHQTVILAQRIARFIKTTIDRKTPLPIEKGHSGTYEARPVHAGDFLILVRSRSRLFTEIIRAAKQEGLPIAGADRLKVMAELAVKDIMALLRFLATPEDDLSLATALRSPLFGISEQQLFDLAHRRKDKAYLWEALRDRREDFPQVLDIILDLNGQTDFLRPYDLIERILTRHKGRRLLVGRLGSEAEDGINALLAQALSYERTDIPSLTGFLEWAESDNLEIKRAAESAGETLRVMTVHGAKGLEAPIVIMPDCAERKDTLRATLLRDEHGLLWKQTSDALPARHSAAIDAAKQAEARERDRLLYVGLTRAEKWLIVAAAGETGKSGNAWYDKVQRGMEGCGAEETSFDFGDLGADAGLTLSHGDWAKLDMTAPEKKSEQTRALPDHLLEPTPEPPARPQARSPSDLGGAKALPGDHGDEEDVAKARGTLIHELIELLAPLTPEARATAGQQLLKSRGLWPEAEPMLGETLLTLDTHPNLFTPDTLAEVPITADLPNLGRIHGIMDRLLITPECILVVDYKTNRAVPDTPEQTPEGLLRQMGAYAAALTQVYPDKDIQTAILWTATAQYMPLPHETVTQALARATTS
ncbi:double-strand break repair helicase AddA [Pacificoceanicola onchidii]|uniref:double-strand break repair helicase AddA n=1 Tax=Pacificoceanicola onchidii TaxID=2562685 RepID=UPI0010A5EA1B|nr:double-strand break repair helicase AddA [Pacificoceanicola onchidii]